MSITAREAQQILHKQRLTENVIFETLWRSLDSEIRLSAQSRRCELLYRVPEFRFGLPRYDPLKVAKRMRFRLRKRGFQVDGNEDTPSMRISWKPPERKPRNPEPARRSDPLAALARMQEQIEINKSLGW